MCVYRLFSLNLNKGGWHRKKQFLLILLFSFFIVNGAIAGSGGLGGDWEGEATAILPDGTIISDIALEGTLAEPEDGLFSGYFEFTLPGLGTTQAYATGYIKARKIQGIMSIESVQSPTGIQGVGFFSAKLKGKKMVGVVRDLSDGSTTRFTANRIETD